MNDKSNNKVNYGIRECSKCEYKLRCEECVYSKVGETAINDIYKELDTQNKISKSMGDEKVFSYDYLKKMVEIIAQRYNIKLK
jgi:hypothetical protein